jgi:Na+/H+-dicarboxylate symporter
VVGVSGLNGGQNLQRIGLKTVVYIIVTSLIAIILGLFLTNIIQPGVGVAVPTTTTITPDNLNTSHSLSDLLIRMLPTNPIRSMVEDDVLGVIVFGIFCGIALLGLPQEPQDKIRKGVEYIFELMMRITNAIIALAPIGVFGLIVKTAAESDLTLVSGIGKYFFLIAFGVIVHGFIILPSILFLLTRLSPIRHFKAVLPALATAFSTSSSNATLPVTMECLEERAGVSNSISSFVIPLGATMNMNGTALYECAGVLFIGQALGIELSFQEQITVVLTALLASIGAAGIPSAGLVMIFIVTKAVGFQDADVALLVGAMLAVDRPLDMLRTVVNVLGDTVGAVIIAHTEGEKVLQPVLSEQTS